MTIGERIKENRIRLKLTQMELAERINVAKQTVFKYETGIVTNIPSDKIEAMARVFGISPGVLMGWDSSLPENIVPLPSSRRYPVIDAIACGKPIEAVQETNESFSFPDDINADVCLRCVGDSMSPKYLDCDIVFIRRQPEVDNGQIAAVYVKDAAEGSEWDVTLKKVIIYRDKEMVILRALNPDYEDIIFTGEDRERLEIFGLAVALCRKT